MLATTLMMSCLTYSPDLDLRITGHGDCADGTRFGAHMIAHACATPIDPIDIRFYTEGEEYCAAVEDSTKGNCRATCEQALHLAAIQVGELIDRTCPDPSEPPVQQELPPIPVAPPVEPSMPEATTPPLVTPPLEALASGVHADLMFATLASARHPDYGVAAGFMSGIGVSDTGTQFALIGGFADITTKDWYWRAGLEVCRGRRMRAWEWSGCFALGGGEIYNGQVRHHQYPWTSFSNSVRFHVTDCVVLRLDFGGQLTLSEPWFGSSLDRTASITPMVTVGVQHTIPVLRKLRG